MTGEKLKTPLSSVPYQLPGSIVPGDVEGEGVQAGQDAGLLQVVDAVGEHAGGDEDQEAAGPGEEPGQVDPDRAAVEQVAEHDGGGEAEAGAEQRLPGRRRAPAASRVPAWVAAHRNSAVSRPSRPTARTATSASDQRLPSAARVDLAAQLAAHGARAARAIQKIIQVTKPTATIDRVPPIASWASKVRPRGPKVSSAPKARLTATATRDAGPDAGQQVPAVRT